jgi:hypothetical protein
MKIEEFRGLSLEKGFRSLEKLASEDLNIRIDPSNKSTIFGARRINQFGFPSYLMTYETKESLEITSYIFCGPFHAIPLTSIIAYVIDNNGELLVPSSESGTHLIYTHRKIITPNFLRLSNLAGGIEDTKAEDGLTREFAVASGYKRDRGFAVYSPPKADSSPIIASNFFRGWKDANLRNPEEAFTAMTEHYNANPGFYMDELTKRAIASL